MPSRSLGAGWAFVAAVAACGSVCGHEVMRWCANAGVAASAYGEYGHVAVAPAGVFALCAAGMGVVRAVANGRGSGHGSGVAVAARSLLSLTFATCFGLVLAVQMAVLYSCESSEQLVTLHRLAPGWDWLGGPAAVALLVHAALALLFTAALRRSLARILQTCDALFRAVRDFVARISRSPASIAVHRPRRCREIAFVTCFLARNHGLRAPPLVL